MKSKDQQLLEEAYSSIRFDQTLHQRFLLEAGLLDKAKQIGSSLLDKAKSMFGGTVEGLLKIVQKTNPELFAKIQKAVQSKDEQALKSIFQDPSIKQSQQQLTKESLIQEGIIDSVKGMYTKAYEYVATNPGMASKLALAGILAAMTAAGPDALSHMAGFLVQVGGKALGGAAIGGAIGGVAGGIQGGWEGAKRGMKKGAIIGAGAGLASGVQDVMAHGASSIEDLFSTGLPGVGAEELASIKQKAMERINKLPEKLRAETLADVEDILKGKDPVASKIEGINDMIEGAEQMVNIKKNTLDNPADVSALANQSKDIAGEVEAEYLQNSERRSQELQDIVGKMGERTKALTSGSLDDLLKQYKSK